MRYHYISSSLKNTFTGIDFHKTDFSSGNIQLSIKQDICTLTKTLQFAAKTKFVTVWEDQMPTAYNLPTKTTKKSMQYLCFCLHEGWRGSTQKHRRRGDHREDSWKDRDRNRINCSMSRVEVSSGTNIHIKDGWELHAHGNTQWAWSLLSLVLFFLKSYYRMNMHYIDLPIHIPWIVANR